MSKNEMETRAPGAITDEGIAQARNMIGVRLRTEGQYIQDVTPDAIRTFCNGIGDLNPIYRDAEHGRTGRYGSIIAPPLFPLACSWVGRARWGFPGVHSFLGGQEWEFFRNIRPEDRITVIERVVGIEEKSSQFSGRLLIQYTQAEFANQRDELVCRVLGWSTRHERKAARERGKYAPESPQIYTEEKLAGIENDVMSESERIRGSQPLYWEDVIVGEELPAVVRGPLSTSDTIGFLVACGRGHSHGLLARLAKRHPGHFVREQGRQNEHTMNVHHAPAVAAKSGMPGAIDFGAQRLAWLSTLVTNWMGDAAVLKHIRGELRLPNIIGDTTWCKGKVKEKSMRDGFPLVELEIWAENQHGAVTSPHGAATVILPSKSIASRLFRDATGIDLKYGNYRG